MESLKVFSTQELDDLLLMEEEGDIKVPEEPDPSGLYDAMSGIIEVNEEAEDDRNWLQRSFTRMTPITEDGDVLKEESRAGEGTIIAMDDLIYFHYDVYFDDASVLFSSRVETETNSVKYRMGSTDLAKYKVPFVAIVEALETMRNKEVSVFFTRSSHTFGNSKTIGIHLGAGGQNLEPGTSLYFKLEILNVVAASECAYADLTSAERQNISFALICQQARDTRAKGTEWFHKKNEFAYRKAAKKYSDAKEMLEGYPTKSDEEEDMRNEELYHIYKNLAAVAFYQDKQKLCIMHSNSALRLNPRCYKTHFKRGQALLVLQDYDKSLEALKRAQRLAQNDAAACACIDKELRKLEEQLARNRQREADMCRRMMGLTTDMAAVRAPAPKSLIVSEEFARIVKLMLDEILADDTSDLPLHLDALQYTDTELRYIEQLAGEKNLDVTRSPSDLVLGKRCKDAAPQIAVSSSPVPDPVLTATETSSDASTTAVTAALSPTISES